MFAEHKEWRGLYNNRLAEKICVASCLGRQTGDAIRHKARMLCKRKIDCRAIQFAAKVRECSYRTGETLISRALFFEDIIASVYHLSAARRARLDNSPHSSSF